MISIYYVYNRKHSPKALLNKYPRHAIYGTMDLFVQGLEIVTGVQPITVIDLVSQGFNHPFNPDVEGLTASELDKIVDELLSTNHTSTDSEVQITASMSKYIYETRFKPLEEI
tara:strand:- start:413 stop:751 length:339 start_codon:yes stop_codon:yes gene_type:complete